MFKRALIAAACSLVAVVGSVPATAQAAAKEKTSGCATVTFIGARGSGQGPKEGSIDNFGPEASKLARATAKRLTGKTVRYIGVPYDAISVPKAAKRAFFAKDSGAYFKSVNGGVREMTRYLEGTARACPKTKFVLIGYSQGAHVAHVTASHLSNSLAPRVTVAMIADPTRKFLNAELGEHFGTTPISNGILGAVAFPRNIAQRTFEVCHQRDVVCNSPLNAGAIVMGTSFSAHVHTTYYKTDAAADVEGRWLRGLLAWRSGLK